MRLGFVAEVADLFGDDPAQKRETQIGAHGLCDGDPVVPRCALHCLITLIDNHADRVVMRRINRRTRGVVTVPCPIRATADPDSIDTKEIARCFDVFRVALCFGWFLRRRSTFAVLQQNKRPQNTALRKGMRTFAGVPPT